MSYDDYDADDESDDLSDKGGAEGKLLVSLMQTEIYSKQFAKKLGQANYCAFNKWKKGWVPGFLERKHRPVIQRQN
jgi:hypothetical protein